MIIEVYTYARKVSLTVGLTSVTVIGDPVSAGRASQHEFHMQVRKTVILNVEATISGTGKDRDASVRSDCTIVSSYPC